MKKILSIISCLILSGCSTVNIPSYIQDKHPYEKKFYASFDKVLKATKETLQDFGWKIVEEADPSAFEVAKKSDNPQSQHVLLFTGIRQTSLFLGSRYARLNIYVEAINDTTTGLDLRYVTVNSIPFKSFTSYQNNRAVERIFAHIEKKLE